MIVHNKHHNTVEARIGITKSGTFSFVSDLFAWAISDPRNVQDSEIFNYVKYGGDIIADRGFLIRGDLAFEGAPLNIPPFSMDKQLCIYCRCKRHVGQHVCVNIHVERAVYWTTEVKNILQGIIPSSTRPVFNEVVKVCAMLCYLDTKLVK